MNKHVWLLFSIVLACISCSKKKELVEYYPNGSIKSVWHFEYDTLNGVKDIYWENGSLAVRDTYSNGKRNGDCYSFYKNGWIAEKATFENGLLHGKVYTYFSDDSAKLKREVYKVLEGDKEFNYYEREFNSEGEIIEDDKNLEFHWVNNLEPLILNYVGSEEYDSMQIVIGNYDHRLKEVRPFSEDTLKFNGNTLTIPYQNKLLTNEFLRGRFYGFNNERKGDTIFYSTYIMPFEEKLKEIPKTRPRERKKTSANPKIG